MEKITENCIQDRYGYIECRECDQQEDCLVTDEDFEEHQSLIAWHQGRK